MEAGRHNATGRRNPTVAVIIILISILSMSGCIETYANVQGKVLRVYDVEEDRFIEVEIMKFMGSYENSVTETELKRGDRITLMYNITEDGDKFPDVEKGDYIKFDMFRMVDDPYSDNDDAGDDNGDYTVTRMETIGHPYIASYFALIIIITLVISTIIFFAWYRNMDEEERRKQFTNTYHGTIACPRCRQLARVETRIGKFMPMTVVMHAVCDYCRYNLSLPTYKKGKQSMWGKSPMSLTVHSILFSFILLGMIIVGTLVFHWVFLAFFDLINAYVASFGEFLLFLSALTLSVIILGLIHAHMKSSLVRTLNHPGISTAIIAILHGGHWFQ